MTDAENEILWNEYFYKDAPHILKNKFNFKEQEKLKEAEATISFEKLLELNRNPLNLACDKQHLKEVHRFIFSDVYPFAGEFRKANLSKTIGSFVQINKMQSIDSYLDEVFSNINKDLSRCSSKLDFALALGLLYTELIHCHPFMEGNGRAIREFVREFSIIKSTEIGTEPLELDWRLVDREKLNKDLAVDYMIFGGVGILFYEALVPINKIKNNK